MSAFALPVPTSSSRKLMIYLREIEYEFLRALRNKGFALAIVGFPTMFYLLFGVSNRGETVLGGANFAKYLLAGYTGFGTVGAALFGIGVGLAFERSSGWLDLKRASPMPPLAYLIARCTMAMLFSVIIATLLCMLGVLAAGVHLSMSEYMRVVGMTVLGSVPFASLGLMLAMMLPPNSAPGIVNLIYLPMSYASGFWIPIPMLPRLVQHVGPFLPTYHLALLMLHTVGYAPRGDQMSTHLLALVGFTFLFLGAAWIAFSRNEAEA